MKKLESFMEKNLPKHARSKLYPHRNAIFRLADENYSSYSIVNYLMTIKVVVDRRTVDKFLKNYYTNNRKKDEKKEITTIAKPKPREVYIPRENQQSGAETSVEAETTTHITINGVKVKKNSPMHLSWVQNQKKKNRGK